MEKTSSEASLSFDQFLALESAALYSQSLAESIAIVVDDQIHFMEEAHGLSPEFVQREWAQRYLLHELEESIQTLSNLVDGLHQKSPQKHPGCHTSRSKVEDANKHQLDAWTRHRGSQNACA